MAYTINTVKKTVMGDMRVHILSCSADATTQNIETGLDRVYGFSLGPVSMTAITWTALPNVLAAGTASAGYISVTGVTATDEFQLICFGT